VQAAFFLDGNDPLGGVSLWSLRIARALVRSAGAAAIGLNDGEPAAPYSASLLDGFTVSRATVTGAEQPGLPFGNTVGAWDDLSPDAQRCAATTDVFFPNYFEFAFRLAATARLAGHPARVVAMCHTDEPYYYHLLTKYAPVITRFVAVSRRCYQSLEQALPSRIADMVYLPYGTEMPVASPAIRPPEVPIRLLHVGRLEQRQKRVLDLVPLTRGLTASGCPFDLRIVGDGSCRDALSAALGDLPASVTFVGVKTGDALRAEYRRADVLVMPSETEGLSFVLLEAMSHGVVPVVSRVSGSEDLVESGVNGDLFDVGDLAAATAAICALAADRASLGAAGKRARDTIAADYTWDRHVAAIGEQIAIARAAPAISADAAKRVLACGTYFAG